MYLADKAGVLLDRRGATRDDRADDLGRSAGSSCVESAGDPMRSRTSR